MRLFPVSLLLASAAAFPDYLRADAAARALQLRQFRGNVKATGDPDAIICPVLAAGIKSGKLGVDIDGKVGLDQLGPFFTALNMPPATLDLFQGLADNGILPVNLFTELNDNLALEHGLSSGIRDPVKNRDRLDILLSYADSNGVLDHAQMLAAAKWFDDNPNPETHNSGFQSGGVEKNYVGFLLPMFGRCGPETRSVLSPLNLPIFNPYNETAGDFVSSVASDGSTVQVPCTTETSFMTTQDLEALYWNNELPSGFKLTEEVPMPKVHGDPMFKVNGTGQHFWLQEGRLTPLLVWDKTVLLGKTFARKDTGNQWFDEFAIEKNGETVLSVAMKGTADMKGLQIKYNGEVINPAFNATYASRPGLKLKVTASGHWGGEQYILNADGLRCIIYPSNAAKFKTRTERANYMHLNLDFEAVPIASKGLFAELAGFHPMTPATRALLKRPTPAKAETNAKETRRELAAKAAAKKKEVVKSHPRVFEAKKKEIAAKQAAKKMEPKHATGRPLQHGRPREASGVQ